MRSTPLRHLPVLISLSAISACGGDEPAAEPVVAPPPVEEPAVDPPRHAMLLVIDTLRRDMLAEAHTPVLDRLISEGAEVDRAWSAGTWTVPSVISILTGMSVRQHGWDLSTGQLGRYPAIPTAPTIATVLEQAGFGTTGLYANPYLAEELGFDRGFDKWKRSVDRSMPKQLAKVVTESWGDGGRHFAYVHLIGPHSPLRPSEEARARWNVDPEWIDQKRGLGIGVAKRNRREGARDAYSRAYRAVIEDTDARVGELLTSLGEYRSDTLIVVTSDHGELLGEHNIVGHGTWVWEGLTRVPLIVDHPGLPPERETLPATLGNASVPALITHHLGIEHRWPTSHDSALPLVSQREGWFAFSADGRHKGIWSPKTEGVEIYDLEADPLETKAATESGQLIERRAEWEATVPAGKHDEVGVTLHPSTQEQLRELGYLQ